MARRLRGERVALKELEAAHRWAAQGSLLVLLLCMLPPSGVGMVLGLALLAWGQWRGRAAHFLPYRPARQELPLHWARRVLHLLAGFYALVGRLSRERWTKLADEPPRAWMSGKVGLMALIIMLPIPLGNPLPALALVLLGLGLALCDGPAVLLGAVTALLALLFTAGLLISAWHCGLAGVDRLWGA